VVGSAAEGDSRESLHENKFGKAYEVIISAEKPPLEKEFRGVVRWVGKISVEQLESACKSRRTKVQELYSMQALCIHTEQNGY